MPGVALLLRPEFRAHVPIRIGNACKKDAPMSASMSSTREERPRRPLLVAFINFGLGLLILCNGFSRPSIANMRMLDLVHLLAAGAGLGAGLAWLAVFLYGRRKS
jgi:hypothetical protein